MSRLVPALAFGLLLVGIATTYEGVLAGLVRDWSTDDNYSHGFLIIPVALYLVWERRNRLARAARRPRLLGLALVWLSLAMLAAGVLGAELFVTRISLISTLGGVVLFIWGWEHLRILLVPLACLLLMIPIPAIVFNQVALPLQLVASRLGETALWAVGIPVLREGNMIVLAHITLEVAEACSGIRSLVSLITLGILLGYWTDPRAGVRAAVALAAIPVAVLTNGLRVAGTGAAAHYWGPQAAAHFFHTFSGWMVFVLAFTILVAVMGLLRAWRPMRAVSAEAAA